jgi:hypothetical protein
MPLRQLQMANMLMLGCFLDCRLDDSILEKLFFHAIEQNNPQKRRNFPNHGHEQE